MVGRAGRGASAELRGHSSLLSLVLAMGGCSNGLAEGSGATDVESETGVAVARELYALSTEADVSATGPRAFQDGFYYVAQGGALSVAPATGLLSNDVGVRPLTAAAGSSTLGGGALAVSNNGSFTYTPPAGFFGVDSFDYTVTDALGQAASGTGRLVVEPTSISIDTLLAGIGGFPIEEEPDPADTLHTTYKNAAAGDVNGDGFGDWLIQANTRLGYYYIDRQTSYIVFGKPDDEPVDLAHVAAGEGGFVVDGGELIVAFGQSNTVGDVNGDGLSDVMLDRSYGEACVVFGKTDTEPVYIANLFAGNGGFCIDGSAGSFFAEMIPNAAGDVNGDGLGDIALAFPYSYFKASDAYVIFGKTDTDPVDLADVYAGDGGFVLQTPPASYSHFWDSAGAGDINGDGLSDVAFATGRTAYVVFGKADTLPVTRAEIEAGEGGFAIEPKPNQVVYSIDIPGDINGDGLADVTLGGTTYPNPGPHESYVVFGKSSTETVRLADVGAGSGGFAMVSEPGHASCGPRGGGHFDADALVDIVLSCALEAFVVYGKSDTSPIDLGDLGTGAGGFRIEDMGSFRNLLTTGLGDTNGDGYADLLFQHVSGSFTIDLFHSVVLGGDFSERVTELGNAGSNLLRAELGASLSDVLSGEQASDVLRSDGGPDILIGGSGADRLIIGDGNFLRVDGGGNADTLLLGSSLGSLDLVALTPSRLESVEVIDLREAGAHELRIDVLGARFLPQRPSDLVIRGTSEDLVRVVVGDAVRQTSPNFVIYSLSHFQLRIENDVVIVEE